MEYEFQKQKEAVAQWAKANGACSGEFKKLLASENDAELLKVLTDNWFWCWQNNMTVELMQQFPSDSIAEARVFITTHDMKVTDGFVYATAGRAVLRGSSRAVLRESSSAELRESSSAVLWESSSAVLWESSSAVLRESSSAELRESSSAELRESSSAVLRESSSAVLRESSSAVLRESSSAELWESSSAELWESSSAVLRGSSSADIHNVATILTYNKNNCTVKDYAVARHVKYVDGAQIAEFQFAPTIDQSSIFSNNGK